mgnify:CR=1 FL=1
MCTFSSSNKAFNLAVALIAVMLFMISCNCLQAVAAPRLESRCNQDGTWGIVVGDAGMASIEQPQPMQLEIWDAAKSETRSMSAGYASLTEDEAGLIGAGRLTLADDVSFQFKDCWNLDHGVLYLDRSVEVNGNAPGGFLSGAVLRVASPQTWPQIEWFAPGMIYGNFDLIPGFAIGGRDYYRPGAYTVRIREDRLPAPLVAALFGDHSSLAVLNRVPRGDSTAAEAMSFSFDVMVDERFQFGAIGAEEHDKTISLGYWFPGSEGEQAYSEKRQGVNGGQAHHRWRRRFHPIESGFTQHYQVAFRFGQAEGLNDLCRQSWRWAWQHLQPKVNPQPIDVLRRCIVDALASQVIEADDRAGIAAAISAIPGESRQARHYRSIMGFIGKTIEGAEFMLAESLLDDSDRGKELRRQAEKIINTFIRLKMNPPESEGLFIQSGQIQEGRIAATINGRPEVYLRCLCDDMKALLRAYQREKRHGIEHPQWLDWARQFADWLLTQQQPGGGFPRAWHMGSGEVLYESPSSSFNAVPFLLRLHQITGEQKHKQAALRAGEFAWQNGQINGRFVGGTVDNADVIDKEAATISLECYLDLYDATKDPKWIQRAKVAADIAETWMYIWDVPMPVDAEDNDLQWKRGIPTTGLQLISTGHTLVDAYMSFDLDEYVRLYKLTGDKHYLQVARILLHNTKAMVELPDRPYGLRGPGWQQEHYSLAQPRGRGRHQYWLPWVATSQLNGIFGLMEVDPELYQRLSKPNEEDWK